jgi:aryl-phospho-beta-D-glucosidase BglC (GH1 family)
MFEPRLRLAGSVESYNSHLYQADALSESCPRIQNCVPADRRGPDGFASMTTSTGAIKYAGVNLSCAEFGQNNLPGTYNTHYTYPNQNEVNYFGSKGMNVIRLPFRWARCFAPVKSVAGGF